MKNLMGDIRCFICGLYKLQTFVRRIQSELTSENKFSELRAGKTAIASFQLFDAV